MATIIAIDFETADTGSDSACAVGMVRIQNGRIVDTVCRLIRPPRATFMFTHIHGITWQDVRNQPAFRDVWMDARVQEIIAGADYFAAHNAPFDSRVLHACCSSASMPVPRQPFICTVKLARRVWGIYPTKLPDVCGRLKIELNHHDAASDSLACARILTLALTQGADVKASSISAPSPAPSGYVSASPAA